METVAEFVCVAIEAGLPCNTGHVYVTLHYEFICYIQEPYFEPIWQCAITLLRIN